MNGTVGKLISVEGLADVLCFDENGEEGLMKRPKRVLYRILIVRVSEMAGISKKKINFYTLHKREA